MQKEGKKCSKKRGKRAEKKSEYDRDRSNFILSCQARSGRKFPDVSNSNLPVIPDNFMFLWTNAVRNCANLLIQKLLCYNIKERHLNGVHQALLLKSWICVEEGPDTDRHRQERQPRMKKSLSFANCKNHLLPQPQPVNWGLHVWGGTSIVLHREQLGRPSS